MIAECPYCELKVDCEDKGHIDFDTGSGYPTKVVLLKCKICQKPLLGIAEMFQVDYEKWEWDAASRLWPDPEADINGTIPELVRNSLIEAKLCFKAKAYSACTVMCGRAIEGVCKHHDAGINSLATGLKKLRESGVIDERMYSWGEALRISRNLGAHATTEQINQEDAHDLLDFSIAICEHIFILNVKFDRFKQRQLGA
ncbi:MAG: hypothetical protein DCF32_08815 [Leptolyngbya sp.]|nr:MAG: hypothetical protein DCF32_08815 [Leptolyngbya sp.]